MTETTVLIQQHRRRELFLEAALRDWRPSILQFAREALAPVDVDAVSVTSLQGLVYAAAAGHARQDPKQRLDSLRWYLAWRKLKGGQDDPWPGLVSQVVTDLTRLENLAQSVLDDVTEQWALDPLEESEHAAAVRDLHLKMTEIYLQALAHYYEDRRA